MNSSKNIRNEDLISCPVCGKIVQLYDVCDNCGWENTGRKNIEGGPNKMTLLEAQDAYKKSKTA